MTAVIYRTRGPVISKLTVLGLCACTFSPILDIDRVNSQVTPAVAVLGLQQHQGRIVRWGGRIVSVTNEKDKTVLEVLSYPLRGNGNPVESRETLGRFLLEKQGYLEPIEFAPGRFVTAVGEITEAAQMQVGDARKLIPVLHASQVYLWPRRRSAGFFRHISIGVGFGF